MEITTKAFFKRTSLTYGAFALGLLLFVGLLAYSYQLRLPALLLGYGEGEMNHNYWLIHARQFKEWLHELTYPMQPILEYLIRKTFWFTFFGFQEREMRYPGLFYSFANMGFLFWLSYTMIKNRLQSPFAGLMVGFFLALWLATQQTDIKQTGFARHYTFTALCSTVWFFTFLFFAHKRKLFYWISVAVVNAHFFFIPLVGAAYVWFSAEEVRKRDWKSAIKQIGLLITIVLIVRILNYPAFNLVAKQMTAAEINWGVVISRAWNDWWQFFGYLNIKGISNSQAALAIFCLAIAWRNIAVQKLFYILLLVFPVFLLKYRTGSEYPMFGRYYTPYFGLGACALFLIFLYALRWYETIPANVKDRLGSAYRFFPPATLLCLFLAATVAFQLPSNVFAFSPKAAFKEKIPRNFTPRYHAYAEVKAKERAVFVLYAECFAASVTAMYMRYIGQRHVFGFHQMNSRSCDFGKARAHARFNKFIQANPNALVVLDDASRKNCKDETRDPIEIKGIRIQKVQNEACVWLVSGARSLTDLLLVMPQVNFDYKEELYTPL